MTRNMLIAPKLLGVLVLAPLLIFATTGFCWGCGYGTPDEALLRAMPSFPPKGPREAAVWRAVELNRRADILITRQQYRQAERILRESIHIFENALGRETKEKARLLRSLARIYDKTERGVEATKIRSEVGKIIQLYCYRPESNEVMRMSQCSADSVTMLQSDVKKWRKSKTKFQSAFMRREYCYRPGANDMQLLKGSECAPDAFQMSLSEFLEWRVSKTSFKLEFEGAQRTTSAKQW